MWKDGVYLKGAMGRVRTSWVMGTPVTVDFSRGQSLKRGMSTQKSHILWSTFPMTHSVPVQVVFDSSSACLSFGVRGFRGEVEKSRNSRILETRSRSSASASRFSWFSSSSWARGRAAENEVVYRGAFVPLPRRPPRPFGTPEMAGASPPTLHTVPTLTCNSQ